MRSGTNQQMVMLRTNDPKRPLVYLTIVGTLPHDVQVNPPTLLLDAPKGQAATKSIKIIGPPTMDISQVSSDNPSLLTTFDLVQNQIDKKIWQVHVSLTQNAIITESKSIVTIKTTHPERSIITVPIISRVRGDLQVTPPGVFFGFVSQDKPKQINIIIESQKQTSFRILEAKLNSDKPGFITVQGITNQSTAQHKLTITLNAKQAQLINSSIEIKTDVPGEEKVIIPVTALVQKAQ